MSRRDGLFYAAIGGLIVIVIGTIGYVLVALSPEPPHKPDVGPNQSVATDYYPGGSECRPKKLAATPPGERQARADRCAEAAEQRRQYEQSVELDRRAVVAAEGATSLAYSSARLGLWQIVLGILTVGAAVWAAYAASRAAVYAKEAANHGDIGALQAQRSADAAVALQRPWVDVEIEPADTMSVHPVTGSLYVPLTMTLINRGGTPARMVCHADGAASEAFDEGEIEKHWPRALERALEDDQANTGINLFPGENKAHKHTILLIFDPNLIDTEGGMFFISHGLVVVYRWGDNETGITKISGVITAAGEHPDWPDGWRISLPALLKGEEVSFSYERHLFKDAYE